VTTQPPGEDKPYDELANCSHSSITILVIDDANLPIGAGSRGGEAALNSKLAWCHYTSFQRYFLLQLVIWSFVLRR
jgi:hypothetical protein